MEELTEELAQVALDAIDEYGAEISFQRHTKQGYDPATSSNSPGAQPGTFKALIEDLKGPQFAGNLVQAGDKKLTAAASGLTPPATGSTVDWGEGAHTVVGPAKATRLGATPIIYEIHVRN